MRASNAGTWARTAPNSILIPILTLLFAVTLALTWLAMTSASAWALSSRTAAAADSGGFRVRVVEEGSGTSRASRAAERVRREADRARDAAQAEAQRAAAQGAAPAPPEPPEPPDVDFGGDNNLVRFGEDIVIPADKTIDGDVVAIGGNVTVYGRVTGDCVAVGGSVHVLGRGVVEGDAVSMGGGVHTSDSASVAGDNVSLGSFPRSKAFWPTVGFFGAMGTGIWLLKTLIKLGLTIFFAWIALLLARERLVYAVETMYHRFGRSFLWGLGTLAAAVVALPAGIVVLALVGAIAIAILAITIIGIPVAILLAIGLVLAVIALVIGIFVALFLGFVNGSMFLGQRVLGRTTPAARRPLIAILVGAGLFTLLELAGRLIGLLGVLVFHPVAIALGIAAGALAVILTIAGFGAMVVTRFAAGPRGEGALGSQWWPSHRPAEATAPGGGAATPQATAPPPAPPADGGTSDAP